MKLTAIAERSGGWWAVEVPEVAGLFTQAKRLDQVDGMVRDAAALLTGQPEDSFDVVVEPRVPEVVTATLEHSHQLTDEAARLQREAAEEARKAARLMQAEGMTVRDIGQVMGVSFQRVSQILAA